MRQRNCNAEVPSLDQVKAERKRLRYRRRYRRPLASTLTALLAAAAIGVLAATLWFPVLEIHGSSMSPTLRDGQIVVAVKSSRFSEGDVIAFYHGNSAAWRGLPTGWTWMRAATCMSMALCWRSPT